MAVKNQVFICTNQKQLLGALVSKFTLETARPHFESFTVQILNVDQHPLFMAFHGKTYLRAGRLIQFSSTDLQSFTLARFMPPEMLGFQGKALVIDPDVFAVQDISPIFKMDVDGAAIGCRHSGRNGWASSVMLLMCERLKHWQMSEIFRQLMQQQLDYDDLMTLRAEKNIFEFGVTWNSFDYLDEHTKLLHTTSRRTQPWKTGLKRDFAYYEDRYIHSKRPRVFQTWPRYWIDMMLGRQPHRYVRHWDPNVERFFFSRLAAALAQGKVTQEFLQQEVTRQHVRRDIFKVLEAYRGAALS